MKFTRVLKSTALIFYCLSLLLWSVLLFVFGVSTIITTLLAYSLFAILGFFVLNKIQPKIRKDTVVNLKILFISTLSALFIGEVTLRYVFKKNLTFNELNGAPYISEYKKIQKQNFRLNRIVSNNINWTKTNVPNSIRIVERDNFRFQHIYNSYGLRDIEFTSINNDSTRIVLGLGDSFTEGVGAHQDSTWLKFFERKWNLTHPSALVKTYNAGISGSDPFFEYQLLLKLLGKIHPKTVIVSINASDIDDCIIRGGMARFKPGGKVKYNPAPWWESIYAVSFIVRTAVNSFGRLDWTLHTEKQKEIKNTVALDSIARCINSFSNLARQRNFKLIVVFTPLEREVKAGEYVFDKLASDLKTDSTFNVINLLDEYRNSKLITPENSGRFYWPSDFHYKAEGYKVWGEVVAEIIARQRMFN